MKLLNFWYKPEADVEFTWTDVESLILLSEQHYDHKCRELSKEGGMLYGMRNMFQFPLNLGTEDDKAIRLTATIIYRLDSTKADLLAKCAEQDLLFRKQLLPIVKALNDEYLKMNAGEPMKTASKFKGVVFDKEDGIAFINLRRGKQVWIPAKDLKVGDVAHVTIRVAAQTPKPKNRKQKRRKADAA